jgi:RNA polymerase sigma factor (sigma-70 family)
MVVAHQAPVGSSLPAMQPPHRPEQHIADMAWLARVARALVHDPATAEDLAQDTWIAALRRRARGEDAGRGWLSRAVRGRLWNLRRDEQRRQERERDVARQEALPSTDSLVERAELQARLAGALARLDEPLRTTALLRFLEGLTPEEIAARQGAKVDTVRKRLRAAVARLRAGINDDDRRALSALAAFAVPATDTLVALGGALAMKKALGIAALVLVGWLALGPLRRAVAPDDALDAGLASALADLAPAPAGPEEPPLVESPSSAVRVAVASPSEPVKASKGELVVVVTNTTGRPVDRHPVVVGLVRAGVDPDREWDGAIERYLWRDTDAEGHVVFTREELEVVLAQRPTGAWCVALGTRTPRPVRVEFAPNERPGEAVALVADLARVVVEVLRPDGGPWRPRGGLIISPEGLHYHSCVGPLPLTGWIPIGVPYRLKAYNCGMHRDAEASFPALLDPAIDHPHTLRLGSLCASIRGRIVRADGAPLPEKSLLDFESLNGHVTSNVQSCRFAPDGSFEARIERPPAAGTYIAYVVDMRTTDRMRDPMGVLSALAPADGTSVDVGDVVLIEPPLLASGRVVGVDGAPLRMVRVVAMRPGPSSEPVPEPFVRGVWTDDSGRFELRGFTERRSFDMEVRAPFRQDLTGMRFIGPTSVPLGAEGIEYRAVPTGAAIEKDVPAQLLSAPDDAERTATADHGNSAPAELEAEVVLTGAGPILAGLDDPQGLYALVVLARALAGEGDAARRHVIPASRVDPERQVVALRLPGPGPYELTLEVCTDHLRYANRGDPPCGNASAVLGTYMFDADRRSYSVDLPRELERRPIADLVPGFHDAVRRARESK